MNSAPHIGRKRPARPRLLSSSTLPNSKVRQIIRCYAEGRSPKETGQISGLSHVTIYRLYRHIRTRLLETRVFTTMSQFVKQQNEMEEGGFWFAWSSFDNFIFDQLRPRHGVREKNKELYWSEAIFRWENAHKLTPDQVYRLILVAVKSGGPLNRPAKKTAIAVTIQEYLRLQFLGWSKEMRHMEIPVPLVNKLHDHEDKTNKLLGELRTDLSETPARRVRKRRAHSADSPAETENSAPAEKSDEKPLKAHRKRRRRKG